MVQDGADVVMYDVIILLIQRQIMVAHLCIDHISLPDVFVLLLLDELDQMAGTDAKKIGIFTYTILCYHNKNAAIFFKNTTIHYIFTYLL